MSSEKTSQNPQAENPESQVVLDSAPAVDADGALQAEYSAHSEQVDDVPVPFPEEAAPADTSGGNPETPTSAP